MDTGARMGGQGAAFWLFTSYTLEKRGEIMSSDVDVPNETSSAIPDGESAEDSDFKEKKSRLKWFYLFAGANAVFMQCTIAGSIFPLYMSKVGLDPSRIGVLIALFPFMQVMSLIATPVVERIGFKKSFVLFYGSRKFTIMAMGLVPFIVHGWGLSVGFYFTAGCILLFGMQRSLGETALYPWRKDFIPDRIRGHAGGMSNMVAMLAAGMGLLISSLIIQYGKDVGLGGTSPFQLTFLIFASVGLIGVVGTVGLPGGGKVSNEHKDAFLIRLWRALHDSRLLRFLAGAGIMQGSLALFAGFMPLYMKGVVGVSEGNIIRLTIAQMAGGFAMGYASGRAADRYGSRPVMFVLLCAMFLMPVGWSCLPLLGDWALWAGVTIYFLFGGALFGARVAEMRFMFNTVVPEEKKSEYLAIRYALVGVIAGCMPLVAGQSVEIFDWVEGTFLGVPLSPYTPLFCMLMIGWTGAIFLFGSIREC